MGGGGDGRRMGDSFTSLREERNRFPRERRISKRN